MAVNGRASVSQYFLTVFGKLSWAGGYSLLWRGNALFHREDGASRSRRLGGQITPILSAPSTCITHNHMR